ncbi:acyl-CoA dehydrogenase family protein [Rhodococcus koreensis]
MTVVHTDERVELRVTARKFFEKYSPESAVRELIESGRPFDRAVWDAMAGQLGLQGLAVPEEYGGAGFPFVDLQIVLEEMGRALVCSPFLSSAVLAPQALLASGDRNACARYLPALADGTTIAALAFTDHRGQWRPDDDSVTARRVGNRHVLDGRRDFVLDGAVADVVFVVASSERGPGLYAVSAETSGLTREPLETLDLTRSQAVLRFEGAPAELVGTEGGAEAAVGAALDAGLSALAAEQVGAARRAMELSVEYARVREQFGRPIGSFQAIKHKCADMLLDVETATSAAYAAGHGIDESSDEAALLASLAKAHCSEAFSHVAAEMVQVHGGIGFTWEHSAHLYFRRAKGDEMLFGAPTCHRERILAELGL